MGQMILVAFEPKVEGFIASVAIGQLESLGYNPEALLREASITYGHHIEVMRSLLDDIDGHKTNRIAIPASKMWNIGDAVFRLVGGLAKSGLEIDGLYEHLERDLRLHAGRIGMYRLTRAITFRRYLSDKALIPHSLHWSLCEKSARKAAQELAGKRKEPTVA